MAMITPFGLVDFRLINKYSALRHLLKTNMHTGITNIYLLMRTINHPVEVKDEALVIITTNLITGTRALLRDFSARRETSLGRYLKWSS